MLKAQEYESALDDIIEEIAQNYEIEVDFSVLYDNLALYYAQPLNLNTATLDELQQIHFLNDIQIQNLLKYRDEFGEIYSIYELLQIDGISRNDVQLLNSFVFVGTNEDDGRNIFSAKKALKYGNHEIFARSQWIGEKQAGYGNDASQKYLGNQLKYYTKYRFYYSNKMSFGIVAEKDAGEEFFKGTQKNGFDYYSAHLIISDIGFFKDIAIGDYQIQAGQGLILWSGFGTAKSSMVLNTSKKAFGIKKYSSTDENLFYRGAATTVKYKNLSFTAFGSLKKIDGQLQYDSLADFNKTTLSLDATGLHTTTNELAGKDIANEWIFGGILNVSKKKWVTGINFVSTNYEYPLSYSEQTYNYYKTENDKNICGSFDYKYFGNTVVLSGEAAVTDQKAFAFVNTASIDLVKQVKLAVLHRHYSNNFYALRGNGFAEGNPQAEKGLYFGIEIYPYQNWKISAYYDSFKFTWLKFGTNSPSHGADYFLQADYNPLRNFSISFRWKSETKLVNNNTDSYIAQQLPATKQSARLHFKYRYAENFDFKTRIEYSFYAQDGQNTQEGYLIYQDANYSFNKFPLQLSFRYAIFNTTSWDSRIYAYETDVLYGFSVPAFYSKGSRIYLVLKTSPTSFCDLWFKIARTNYSEFETLGSGLAEIEGNTKTEYKIQLRFRF